MPDEPAHPPRDDAEPASVRHRSGIVPALVGLLGVATLVAAAVFAMGPDVHAEAIPGHAAGESGDVAYVHLGANGLASDDVGYVGTLSLGPDRCLYVTANGTTYLAGLVDGDAAGASGVTSGETVYPYDVQTFIGRWMGGDVPTSLADRCHGASEAWGLAFVTPR